MNLPEVEFHNIPAPEPWTLGGGGYLLPRYPEAVRNAMDRGMLVAQDGTGAEIRFVTEAPTVRAYLAAVHDPVEVHVFCGDFLHSSHTLAPGGTRVITFARPERFPLVTPDKIAGRRFPEQVWRLCFNRNAVTFHGLETYGHAVRAPQAGEKPRVNWLAYGSSITHSSWKGYPQQAAWRLGVDVQNKGLSGCCCFEPTTADFLAQGCSWDLITMELGINVRAYMEADEFERRTTYLLDQCLAAKPGRPIVLITVYPNFSNWYSTPDATTERQLAYNEILRGHAARHASQNVHLLEGSDILSDLTGLGIDLLHPTEFGNVQMGENLARLLGPIVAGIGD